jgi:TPR repeat protein
MNAPRRWRFPAAFASALAIGACSNLEIVHGAPAPSKSGRGVVIGGASGPPDLNRGIQALNDGRLEDAKRDLEPLAKRGYLVAQTHLARLYAQADTPEARQKAIHWYSAALPQSPDSEVPLARLLENGGDSAQLAQAEQLLRHAYEERGDARALGDLINFYIDHPDRDRQGRVAALAAKAEASDAPEARGAVIHWYRVTAQQNDHGAKLLAICKRSLDLVPDCYVDLIRAARAAGDKAGVTRYAVAAVSQFGQGRLPANVGGGVARALVEVPNDGDEIDLPPPVSDQTEDRQEPSATPLVLTAAANPPSGVNAPAANAPTPIPGPPPGQGTCHESTVLIAAPAPGAPAQAAAAAPPDGEPDLANQMVKKLAAGAPDAQVEAAGVTVRYPYLSPDLDSEALLKKGLDAQVVNAPLYLGELYMQGNRAARDPEAAQHQLQHAALVPATATAAQYYLGRLYENGYLDESDPKRALQYLLKAARLGYAPADGALARLFSAGHGACSNKINAYVFARLGAPNGSAEAQKLLPLIVKGLSIEQLANAETLYEQERAARPLIYRPGPTSAKALSASAGEHNENGS